MTNPNPRTAKGREELRDLCTYYTSTEGRYFNALVCARGLATALDEIERLRGALERYGEHEPCCDMCSCGFDAALSEEG